jgi:hypothetical protein
MSSRLLCFGIAVILLPNLCGAAIDAATAEELKLLREQNALLKQKVDKQDAAIESLNTKVADLEKKTDAGNGEASGSSELSKSFDISKVHLSGEGAVAFFHSDKKGLYPNSEFRVDEAKVFIDAPVWKDVYFFAELNLQTHEKDSLGLEVGEIYLDFEDVSKLWGKERQLNVRAGRFDLPFGEEYIYRDAIDDPLISHSIVDLWGVDEGVEVYGSFGKFGYTVAVQNGGIDGGRDFNSDKSVIARFSYDPTRWLHMSVSGMRTGDLDAKHDFVSAMWIGNGFFRSIGSSDTKTFSANLVEGDIIVTLPRGRIHAFGGYINYDDDDSNASNRRDLFYYSFEGIADITKKFYVGGRFSQIIACKGYPVAGNGSFDEYFNDELTQDMWRLSVGAGYRFSSHLVVKAEYTLEQGRTMSGRNRSGDQFAAEAAFGF